MFGTLWNRFKLAITPESHAETLVNEMYSPQHRGMKGLPGFTPLVTEYDPESASTPQFVVTAKRTVTSAITQATGTINKYLIIGGIFIVLLVAVNAFVRR